MFDVSGLVPQARAAAHAAAHVYWAHTHPWGIGLVCYGSAVKGGCLPGVSDIDLHLYLEAPALTPQGQLPLPLALAIHRELATIDPAPFAYIDGSVETRRPLPAGHVGHIPGAYHVIVGHLPVAEATAEQLRAQARWALSELVPVPACVSEGLLVHGRGRGQLAPTVRLLCQTVWPVLYQVVSLQSADALAVWRATKQDVMAMLPPGSRLDQKIRAFYLAMQRYYPTEGSIEAALTVIERGVTFLEHAKRWFETLESSDASKAEDAA